MGKPRDFDAEFAEKVAELTGKAGLEFKLAGQTFHTKGNIPPAALLMSETGLSAAATFMARILVLEDRAPFLALIENPDAPIISEQIDQIAAWIIEEVSGRPTKSPASSGNGVGRTSSGSNPASEAATTGQA